VQAHPQTIWFGKNPGKIPENLGKITGNLGKISEIRAKMEPNVLWFEKMVTWRVFFRRSSEIWSSYTKSGQIFFGQVWGNLGKNPSHPQKFTCSYTYVLNYGSCLFCPFTSFLIISSSYFSVFVSYAAMDPAYFVKVTSLLDFGLRYAAPLNFNGLLILG